MSVEFFKYVPHGFVHIWEEAGWIALPALRDTHHGFYSTLMKAGPNVERDENGEPKIPLPEAA